MATMLLEKTLNNGGLVTCDLRQDKVWGGMFVRTTRRTHASEHSPWRNTYRPRTTTEYSFQWRLPQALTSLFRMDVQYAAVIAFALATWF